jgi:hypothetical protein
MKYYDRPFDNYVNLKLQSGHAHILNAFFSRKKCPFLKQVFSEKAAALVFCVRRFSMTQKKYLKTLNV